MLVHKGRKFRVAAGVGSVPEGRHEVDGEEVDFGQREVTVM